MGNLGRWEIIEDETALTPPHVLAQTSNENFGYHFNLAVIENTDYGDLELEVKFKAVSGDEDQGGGPIWRYQDPDNFRVYKVANGNCKQLDSAHLKITPGELHTIKIINNGDKILCCYDDRFYLEVKDNTFEKGKIGLRTKADSITYFDNLVVKALE